MWAARLALGLAMQAARSASSGSHRRLTVIESAEVVSIGDDEQEVTLAAEGVQAEQVFTGEEHENGGQGQAIDQSSPYWASVSMAKKEEAALVGGGRGFKSVDDTCGLYHGGKEVAPKALRLRHQPPSPVRHPGHTLTSDHRSYNAPN